MSDIKALDVAAGQEAVNAMTAGEDLLNTTFSAMRAALDNLAPTWHGNSKAQFDGEWNQFAAQTAAIGQRLAELKHKLSAEIRQVEETFSA